MPKKANAVKIVLEGERPISWNQWYSGKHWSHRKKEADRVKWTVRSAIDPNVRPFQVPVRITVRAFFKSRPQDASNIAAKLYEDALIGWLLEDDGPRFVRSMTTESRTDKANPRVEIEIQPLFLD